MSIQTLLNAKGRFVPVISSNVLISDVIDKLEIDKAGCTTTTSIALTRPFRRSHQRHAWASMGATC